MRSQIVLEHDADTDLRTLTVGKANYAPKGDAMRFAWVDWAFMLETDLPPDTARALADNRIGKVAGSVIGGVTAILSIAFFRHRSKGH